MYISITPTLIELNDAFRKVVGLDPFFITATSSHCAINWLSWSLEKRYYSVHSRYLYKQWPLDMHQFNQWN